MSANITEVLIQGRAFPNVLALPRSTRIGELEVETTIEESHTDDLEITSHPVERGSEISDHSYRRPSEVVLTCGWSNASLKALIGIVTGFFAGGTMSKGDYVSGIYSQLLKLQQSRQPFSLSTGLRTYDNMLLRSLNVTRDATTSHVLMVKAICREVILVSTQSVEGLPPKEAQADPASTAAVESLGNVQPITGFPAPGGTVTPNDW